MQVKLDYDFQEPALLRQALTHRSAGNKNNERLEFLGDSILNFVIADELFRKFPKLREGDLSRLRALLVKGETLAKVGQERELGQALTMGLGEQRSGGHRRASILADAVEAVLGAVYVDGGFEPCRTLILSWFSRLLDELPHPDELKDPKTRLQEFLQGRQMELPRYELTRTEGADHAQTFYVTCEVAQLNLQQSAVGTSRRKAEQAAATAMLDQIAAAKSSVK